MIEKRLFGVSQSREDRHVALDLRYQVGYIEIGSFSDAEEERFFLGCHQHVFLGEIVILS